MTKLFVALAFLGLNLYTYHFLAGEAVKPPRKSFAEFPMEPGEGWTCTRPQGMDAKIQKNLGVTDFLLCDFGNRERSEIVNVYVGYHASQVREEGGGAGENAIHPPAHCLPGSGWDIIENDSVPLDFTELPQPGANVKRLIIAKGEARQLVYYWYQSRGRVISDDWKKIVYVGLDRATKGRTDGSLVRFTMPIRKQQGDVERAEASFRSLAPRILGPLGDYVPES
ncbi:MAG: EpsI family protein [Myxococcota bacterium]|nr:EpsI family protein [Myxococcota bacterium]